MRAVTWTSKSGLDNNLQHMAGGEIEVNRTWMGPNYVFPEKPKKDDKINIECGDNTIKNCDVVNSENGDMGVIDRHTNDRLLFIFKGLHKGVKWIKIH